TTEGRAAPASGSSNTPPGTWPPCSLGWFCAWGSGSLATSGCKFFLRTISFWEKEVGSGTSQPRTVFFADHFFFREKRNGPRPKEKSLSGAVQSTPISGAAEHCDHRETPLSGVTPCRRAAFGADTHPSGAPAPSTWGRLPKGVLIRG